MDKIISLIYVIISFYFLFKVFKPSKKISSNSAFFIFVTMTLLFAFYGLINYQEI